MVYVLHRYIFIPLVLMLLLATIFRRPGRGGKIFVFLLAAVSGSPGSNIVSFRLWFSRLGCCDRVANLKVFCSWRSWKRRDRHFDSIRGNRGRSRRRWRLKKIKNKKSKYLTANITSKFTTKQRIDQICKRKKSKFI